MTPNMTLVFICMLSARAGPAGYSPAWQLQPFNEGTETCKGLLSFHLAKLSSCQSSALQHHCCVIAFFHLLCLHRAPEDLLPRNYHRKASNEFFQSKVCCTLFTYRPIRQDISYNMCSNQGLLIGMHALALAPARPPTANFEVAPKDYSPPSVTCNWLSTSPYPRNCFWPGQ